MSSTRQIVIDTETTGVDIRTDRVAEIGAVELVDLRAGRTFHAYVNPGMPMPADATAVHGLTDAFLAGMPTVGVVLPGLLEFIGDAPVVAHNASFDVGMLNAELVRCGRPPLANTAIDTLAMARQSILVLRLAWTRCASGMVCLRQPAQNTALCSTRNCWLRCMSSLLGGKRA